MCQRLSKEESVAGAEEIRREESEMTSESLQGPGHTGAGWPL